MDQKQPSELEKAQQSESAPTVQGMPLVTTNLTNLTINAGGNGSFQSAANGSTPITEQWQVSTDGGATFKNVTDGGVYSGSGTPTLTITGCHPAMNGYAYHVIFSNGFGTATTTAATLSVNFAPSVTANPTNQTVNDGGNTSFTAAATGNPNPTFQWQVSTDGGATFSNVNNDGAYSGATTGTLNVSGVLASMNAYEYQAVFSNTLFGAGSPTSVTSTTATLTVDYPPTVTTNPIDETISVGANTICSAAAIGNPVPTIQWQISTDGGVTYINLSNGGVYSGVTTGTLSIINATLALNGDKYQAVFSNTLFGAGSPSTATTTAATLTVQGTPQVTTNSTKETINTSGNALFFSAATDSPGFFTDLFYFLRHNKRWWLIPIFIILLLMSALMLLSTTGAAPFIYTLF